MATTSAVTTRARWAAMLLGFAMIATACSDGTESSLDRAIERLGHSEGPSPTATSESPDQNGTSGDERGQPTEPEPDPTPLPIDPDLTIGMLDNGLTYYLRSNSAPGANLELRLVIDAGSLQEAAPGLGIAHFLEHMLFNGTERYPGNELDRALREIGAEIGPDFNAFTSYDETVYSLNIATFERSDVETAFDVLVEWAAAATIEPAAVVAERGVVRDELRQRVETGQGFIVGEFDRVYTQGTAYAGFDPIGSAESIDSMEAPELRDFYDSWYRPDNMAIVAVGDLPVEDLEELVVERFSGLTPRAPSDERVEADPALSPTAETHVFTHPDEANSYISIDIPIQPWDQSTVGGERLTLMESVISEMVQNRLTDAHSRGELAQTTIPNFGSFAWARQLHFYGTNFQAEDLPTALDEYLSLLATVGVNGFDQPDFDRARETIEAGLDLLLESRASTQDFTYADQYAAHFLGGADVSAIDDSVERARAILDSLEPADLTDHFRWQLATAGPIVAAVGPDAESVPTVAELDTAIASVEAGRSGDAVPLIDELMPRPDGVVPIETNTLPETGAAEWTFANGSRVVFVESDIAEGAVSLWATSSGGWSLLEPGDAAIVPLVTTAVALSGIGPHDRATLDRFLAGSTATLDPFIDETSEGFFGGSGSDDLVTLFQLLHLSVTGPRVDDPALAQALNDGENTLAAAATDPGLQQALALRDARFGDDPWHVLVPTRAQLDGLTAESVLALYEERLGDVDDLIVAVVGDVDVQTVGLMAERYVGTLPAGPPDTFADVLPPAPPGIETRSVLLDDDVTAAGLVVGHETERELGTRDEVTAEVLANIINSRLFLSVREDLGASYGGFVTITPVFEPRNRLESLVDVSGDPDRLDQIRETVLDALESLAETGPTDTEFAQAVAVVGNDLSFVTNFDILETIIRQVSGEEDEAPTQRARLAELEELRPDEVQQLAAELYPGNRRIEVVRSVG